MPEIEDYGAREPSKHEKAAARRLALAQTHPGFREKKRERGTLGGPRELLANPVDTSGSRGFLRRGEKKRGDGRAPRVTIQHPLEAINNPDLSGETKVCLRTNSIKK